MKNFAATFSKYSFVAFASFLSDWAMFLLLTTLSMYYLYAQVIARLTGGVVSFFLNKFWSFESREVNQIPVQAVRFAMLYVFTFCVTIILLQVLVNLGTPVAVAKLLSDGVGFVINFFAMKFFVYAPEKTPAL